MTVKLAQTGKARQMSQVEIFDGVFGHPTCDLSKLVGGQDAKGRVSGKRGVLREVQLDRRENWSRMLLRITRNNGNVFNIDRPDK